MRVTEKVKELERERERERERETERERERDTQRSESSHTGSSKVRIATSHILPQPVYEVFKTVRKSSAGLYLI